MTTATTTRERPVLFSGPMVRAILDGSKTQTRRVVKGEWARALNACSVPTTLVQLPARLRQAACDCPYGQPGDRLWVRETFGVMADKYHRVAYAADTGHTASGRAVSEIEGGRWRPSIFMPRSACRLVLELTDVRVERLQAITAEGAIAEGIPSRGIEPPCLASAIMYLHDFEQLWNGINGARGYGWDANPWVWVVSFQRAQDSLAGASVLAVD
jgi:hypothetical protein